jgi:hypothetical protein
VHFNPQLSSLRVAHVFLFSLVASYCHTAHAEQRITSEQTLARVRAITADLEARLQLPQRVQVSIVPADERMLSVQRVREDSGADEFTIRLDQSFLNGLSDEELTAAIAHELGHVWISCHHPYLQTEALANEIAMRVVSRDSMKKVYAKLWLHLGTSGDFEQLLGRERKVPANVAAASNLIIK